MCVYVYTCAIDPKFIRVRMCLCVLNVTSQAFGRHPLYSKYYDKTGVLVRKDDDFECWWAGSHLDAHCAWHKSSPRLLVLMVYMALTHAHACARTHTHTSDFKRPSEALQKIKEKRQKEEEERESQMAIALAIARGCTLFVCNVPCCLAKVIRIGSSSTRQRRSTTASLVGLPLLPEMVC